MEVASIIASIAIPYRSLTIFNTNTVQREIFHQIEGILSRCQNEFMESSFYPKYEQKIVKISALTKGQLISKCPFGFIVWTKIPTKLFLDFCPEFFCSFLGASWKLFGLPGDLVCNIINKEACRKPQKAFRKPPGRYKKFQGRNSEIISLVILSKR